MKKLQFLCTSLFFWEFSRLDNSKKLFCYLICLFNLQISSCPTNQKSIKLSLGQARLGTDHQKSCGGSEFSSRRNFFSSLNSLYEFFLGHSMNIFQDYLACMDFFSFNFPLREYFFCNSPAPPPHYFSNGATEVEAIFWTT